MRKGIDVSNWTNMTLQQAEFIKSTMDFCIIGLQSNLVARHFKALLDGMNLEYYVDVPGRDLTVPEIGSRVWIDIEENCFTDAQSVRDQGSANTEAGMASGIYGNRTSIQPVFGSSTELADYGLPLWYANYIPPVWDWFIPFNGWTKPTIWQYAGSVDYQGVNVDLNVMEDLPPPTKVESIGVKFSDGSTRVIWV